MMPSLDIGDDDEFYDDESVTEAMAAIGALVLLKYTDELGRGAAMTAARRAFCAMRAAAARERGVVIWQGSLARSRAGDDVE